MKDEYSLECKNMARNSDKEGNRLSLHRYVELDYLRAISVMCVFIVHTYGMIPWSLFQKVVSKLSLQNSVAVFFVISGFLAFSVDQETGTVEYYKNRFVRIFPVYWITFHLNIWINCFVMRTMSFDWWRYLVGLLGMQMAIPSRVYQWNGLGASGSLSAIITFYLIVPLLRKIITSRQRAFIILGGGGVIICELAFILMSTLLVFYGESGHWLPYFCPQTNIWYFLIGIALWWIKDQVKQIHILIFAIGAFCAIIVKGYDSYSFFALCTALALCVYWKYGSIKLRKNKIITSLNRISYAFWLVHPIVVRLISVHIGIYLKHAAGVEYVEWLAVLVLSIMGSILLTEITSKRGGFVVMLRNSINDDIGGER